MIQQIFFEHLSREKESCYQNHDNPEETKTEKDTCTPVFTAALFTIARTQKQPICPLTDEWIKKFGTSTQWNITQPLKGTHLGQF